MAQRTNPRSSTCSACRQPGFRMCSHRGNSSWRPP
jgi:hypothetical protein